MGGGFAGARLFLQPPADAAQGAFLRGRPPRRAGRGRHGDGDGALADLRIPGWHNVENALAAVAVAHIAGMPPEAVREALRQFEGVPHRLERVAVVDGVTYVNDSIATSPARTAAALASFQQPIVLLAGGSDKNLPFEPLAEGCAGPARESRRRIRRHRGENRPGCRGAGGRGAGRRAGGKQSARQRGVPGEGWPVA